MFSDEDISLDMVGSLEEVPLPGGDQMKDHLREYKKAISKDCKFLSSDHFFLQGWWPRRTLIVITIA